MNVCVNPNQSFKEEKNPHDWRRLSMKTIFVSDMHKKQFHSGKKKQN